MDAQTMATTRRTLHGIAEGVLAGPQHRRTGELALRQSPGGFATTAGPDLRVEGHDLVVDGNRRIPLTGTFADLATAAGVDFGEAAGLYDDHSGVGPHDLIELDDAALAALMSWYEIGATALAMLTPDVPAQLWPEHFDLAVDLDDATYGVSPGDAYEAEPYAYISVMPMDENPFWNAPFGAVASAPDLPAAETLVDFWRQGHRLLGPS